MTPPEEASATHEHDDEPTEPVVLGERFSESGPMRVTLPSGETFIVTD